MNNGEYRSVMQMLNNKQYELCSHIMQQLENNCQQMFIFIEGGAGVGKTLLGCALCETITRFHKKKAGNADNTEHILILTPTSMAAYHIKRNNISYRTVYTSTAAWEITPINS